MLLTGVDKVKTVRIAGIELRGVLYDDKENDVFVDLRKTDNGYTVNAIKWPYEYEMYIGKRWLTKKIPSYISTSLTGLATVIERSFKDPSYKDSIKVNNLFD